MRDQKRRGSWLIGALPPRRLKKLPHSPRSAIGTTGTGRRSRIFSTPRLNSFISPSRVSLPSGKDADDFAVGELGVDAVEGLLQRGRILARRRDGNGARGAEDEAHDRDLEDVVIHDEPHRPPHAATDHQRIHEAHVIADDERRARSRECSPGRAP